jgi:hypothetical protein
MAIYLQVIHTALHEGRCKHLILYKSPDFLKKEKKRWRKIALLCKAAPSSSISS